jgi:hypothetical protein
MTLPHEATQAPLPELGTDFAVAKEPGSLVFPPDVYESIKPHAMPVATALYRQAGEEITEAFRPRRLQKKKMVISLCR